MLRGTNGQILGCPAPNAAGSSRGRAPHGRLATGRPGVPEDSSSMLPATPAAGGNTEPGSQIPQIAGTCFCGFPDL